MGGKESGTPFRLGLIPLLVALIYAVPAHGGEGPSSKDGGVLDGTVKVVGEVRVRVSGSLLSKEVNRQAMGPPPSNEANLATWSAAACGRIVKAHQGAGYDYARAWFSLEEEDLIWIFVDPGRMRVSFVGVGGVGSALFRLSLNLPNNVFHKPTLELALTALRGKFSLVSLAYQVRDLAATQLTPFGLLVPEQLLQITVVSKEFLGFALDVSLSAMWGVVPGLTYHRANLILDDDRLFTRVVFAFPYRQYLTEEAPRLRWLHGGFDAAYRLPRHWLGLLALRIETSLYLSHFTRPDLAIKSYNFLRSTTVPALVLVKPAFQISLGAGLDVIDIFRVQRQEALGVDPSGLGDLESVRGLVRLVVNWDPGDRGVQRDRRSWLHMQTDVASSDIQRGLFVASLTGQLALISGWQQLRLRGRGFALAGDVRFWDELQLGGDYQRVFFGNRYWVRQAAQLEVAYRMRAFRDWFALGVFHDTSIFGDRSRPNRPATIVNAFGPSVHFRLFDTFALDLFAGFGFSPRGFDQTVTFALQTIF